MLHHVQGATCPVLMAFTASWCAPCKAMHPLLEELAQTYAGVLSVLHLDVEKERGSVEEFKVTSVPTYILVKDGQEVGRVMGARKPDLKALFEQGAALVPTQV